MKFAIAINFTAVIIVVFACSASFWNKIKRQSDPGVGTGGHSNLGPSHGGDSNDDDWVKKVTVHHVGQIFGQKQYLLPAPPTRHEDSKDGGIPKERQPKTLLIGVRGFDLLAPDTIQEESLKLNRNSHIAKLGSNGVSGKIQPVFPTVPVSNLYSMVTGAYPRKHGIVADEFYDEDLGGLTIGVEPNTFAYNKKTGHQQPLSNDLGKQIYGGEPIWQTLKGRVACIYWPGCEFGDLKDHFVKFNPQEPDSWETRIKKVKQWLEDSRINLVLIDYRDLIDVVRRHGTVNQETKDKLVEFDSRIGALADELGSHLLQDPEVKSAGDDKVLLIFRKLKINLIIVGTSGTASLHSRSAYSHKLPIPREEHKFGVWTMQPTMWLVEPKSYGQITPTLNYFDTFPGIKVFKKEHKIHDPNTDPLANIPLAPKEWRYTGNKRIPSLIVTAQLGTKLSNRKGKDDEDERNHDGYSNVDVWEMLSAFIAYGAAFKEGGKVDEYNMGAVNVHLLLCKLAGEQPPSGADSVRHIRDYGDSNGAHITPEEYIDWKILKNKN